MNQSSSMAAPLGPRPHVMVLPFPAQGHVMPLMELSHRLVHHGLQVVFVNTDFNHGRVLQALAAETGGGDAVLPDGIHMVSFPDGMGPDGDRTDIAMLADGLPGAMLCPLQEMIRSRKTRWVIADVSMSWALDLADPAAGVRVALFSTFSAAAFALRLHVPRLIEQGILDECGNVKRNETIRLSPKMPPIEAAEIPWASLSSSPERRKVIIQNLLKTNPAIQQADTVICNTFEAIESEALAMVPHALPVGPLEAPAPAASRSAGQFWPEDPACLPWLDAQPRGSVVYVAFGSFTVFDAARFQELAGGLELTGRPFLWVVRPNFTAGVGEGWFDAFRRRVEVRGLVVGWAPQQRVLSHPAVACFLTHCGWNSTMEGLRHGVPLLCWPYFADQFCNQSYVCNVWGNGVKLCADERGVVSKKEIRNKVAQLLGDEGTKERAAVWKDAACASIADGGSSRLNLLKLVDLLTEQELAVIFQRTSLY